MRGFMLSTASRAATQMEASTTASQTTHKISYKIDREERKREREREKIDSKKKYHGKAVSLRAQPTCSKASTQP